MSKNGKWKRPAKLDTAFAMKQIKPRDRTRSTVFEDEIGKAERRGNRRHNERQEIEDQLEEELIDNQELFEIDGWDCDSLS